MGRGIERRCVVLQVTLVDAWYRREIEQLLRGAGYGVLADGRLAAGAHLGTVAQALEVTRRDLELLEAAAGYDGSKEIGAAVGIKEKAVNAHLQRLMEKLEVHSRAHLIARALVLGLLRVEHLS